MNHICFSPVSPYHYVVSSGTKNALFVCLMCSVILYSGESRQKIKSFSRFLDIAYSGIVIGCCLSSRQFPRRWEVVNSWR